MVMAAAHRLVFASRTMMEVDLIDLVIEVSEGLRVIAGLPAAGLSVQSPGAPCAVALDQAIGIGLYLAVTLPPYLNRAAAEGSRVKVRIGQDPLSLKIIPQSSSDMELDALRHKLMKAYVRQLAGTTEHDHDEGGPALHFVARNSAGMSRGPAS
jgi:hypothetical protein